jgi:hypothetical protein
VDDLLGVQLFRRISGKDSRNGRTLGQRENLSLGSEQLCYLIKTAISHSAIRRVAWSVENCIVDGEEAEHQRLFEGSEPLEGRSQLRFCIGRVMGGCEPAAGKQTIHKSTGGDPEHRSVIGRKGLFSPIQQELRDRHRPEYGDVAGTPAAGSSCSHRPNSDSRPDQPRRW